MTHTPEEIIDAAKALPIMAVQIFWSREHLCFIAIAPVYAGVIGYGPSFSAAAFMLEQNLSAEMAERATHAAPDPESVRGAGLP